ncbi:MAG: hypothetical protein RL094_208 [Candidatus Parcubacteria bacterium]|jgi:MFS family permease
MIEFTKPIRVLILASMVMTLAFGIFTPFYVVFIQSLKGSLSFAGLSMGVFSIVSGIFILFIGRLESHHKNKKHLLAVGYFLRGLAFVSLSVAVTNIHLLLIQVLLGMGSAFTVPAFDALYTKYVNREDSTMQWAGLQSMTSISTGIAALAGGIFIEYFGFQSIFLSLGCISIVLSLYIFSNKELI